jgi:hypothetical protein
MAFTAAEKKEIEIMMRKEIKDFFGTTTIKQYEQKLIDILSREIKKGKLEGEVKDIVIRSFRELYSVMWNQRSFWESRLKNA